MNVILIRSMGIAVVLDTVTVTAPLTVVGLAVAVGLDVVVGLAVAELLDGAGVGVGLGLVGFGDGEVGVGDAVLEALLFDGLALVASEELLPEQPASASTPTAAIDTATVKRRTTTSKDT